MTETDTATNSPIAPSRPPRLLARPAWRAKPRRCSSRAIPASRRDACRRSGSAPPQVFDIDDEATRQKAAAVLSGADRRRRPPRSILRRSMATPRPCSARSMAPAGLRDKLFIATKLEAPDAAELKRSLSRLQDGEARPAAIPQCRAIRSSRWRSSRRGRRRAFAAISASHRRRTATSPRSKRCSRARSRISCRSTIRSTTAKPRSASCRRPPRSRPAVLTALPFGRGAAVPRRARQGAARLGARLSPGAGRSSSSNTCWATRA